MKDFKKFLINDLSNRREAELSEFFDNKTKSKSEIEEIIARIIRYTSEKKFIEMRKQASEEKDKDRDDDSEGIGELFKLAESQID